MKVFLNLKHLQKRQVFNELLNHYSKNGSLFGCTGSMFLRFFNLWRIN